MRQQKIRELVRLNRRKGRHGPQPLQHPAGLKARAPRRAARDLSAAQRPRNYWAELVGAALGRTGGELSL
ncbi:hypothetical protein ACPA9J_16200 [Pseudomonas aeruginosa]